MTNPEVALLMLSLFILLVLLGFPIAFTLLAMGVGFGYYAYYQGAHDTIGDFLNNNIFYLLNQNTYSVMENPTLVAIPLFLFMGYVVERANIVDRLFFSLYMAARNLPGSLAIAALLKTLPLMNVSPAPSLSFCCYWRSRSDSLQPARYRCRPRFSTS